MLSRSMLILMVVIVAGGFALAQAQPQPNQGDQGLQGNQDRQAQGNQDAQDNQGMQGMQQRQANQGAETLQSFLASCLALGNHEEIVLSDFAKRHVSNDKVKKFVDMMVSDHQKAMATLQRFVPPNVAMVISRDVEGQNREMAQGRTDPATRTTMRPTEGSSQLLQIQLQATKNCIKLTKDSLSQMQGDEFDKAYMGQQIGAHIAMLAKLQAMEPFVSGDLKKVVENTIQATQSHLDEAKTICRDLAGQERTRDKQG